MPLENWASLERLDFNEAIRRVGSHKVPYLYILFHPEGYPFWVGFSQAKYAARLKAYVNLFYGGRPSEKYANPAIVRIVRKYKWEIRVAIYYFTNTTEALQGETFLIKLIGRHNEKTGPLLNITEGGERGVFYGRKHTEESKRKMGTNLGKKFSKETRRKMSESLKKFYREHPEMRTSNIMERGYDGRLIRKKIQNKPSES